MEQANILGLYPLAFYGILLAIVSVLLIIFKLWNDRRQRLIYEKEISGKMLCEWASPEGIKEELCDVWKGMIRKAESASRGTFASDRWVKAPKGYEQFADIYLVLQDHCFPVRYPTGKPYSQQTVVMKTHYLIGDPIPKITYNPSEWDIDRYSRTTTAIMKYAFDEKTMHVIISAIADITGKIQALLNYLKLIPIMFLAQGIVLVVVIIGVVSSCQARATSQAILDFIQRGG